MVAAEQNVGTDYSFGAVAKARLGTCRMPQRLKCPKNPVPGDTDNNHANAAEDTVPLRDNANQASRSERGGGGRNAHTPRCNAQSKSIVAISTWVISKTARDRARQTTSRRTDRREDASGGCRQAAPAAEQYPRPLIAETGHRRAQWSSSRKAARFSVPRFPAGRLAADTRGKRRWFAQELQALPINALQRKSKYEGQITLGIVPVRRLYDAGEACTDSRSISIIISLTKQRFNTIFVIIPWVL